MKSAKCIKILENCLQSYVQKLEPVPDWMFHHDIDTKHTAKVTHACFEDNSIKVIKRPKPSPDMNQIEIFWKLLKKRIREKLPKNLCEIELFCTRKVGKSSSQNMLGTCEK